MGQNALMDWHACVQQDKLLRALQKQKNFYEKSVRDARGDLRYHNWNSSS